MGLLSLKYRRPQYVDKEAFRSRRESDASSEHKSDASLSSGRSGASYGIPEALSFDKIIAGGTCPPCTIRDFMNYLMYIEHAAENLQFFLWYRDYVTRFAEASASERVLAPEWTQEMEDETAAKIQRSAADKMKNPTAGSAADIFKGTDFEKPADFQSAENKDPFGTPPLTPGDERDVRSISSGSQVATGRGNNKDAFAAAGARQPFTIQPFRSEINRVIATYIADDAPRQLNLSSRQQKAAVQALAYTTHPSALRSVAGSIEGTLRRQAHPNFVRWSICNGNPVRTAFARCLGVGVVMLSNVGAVLVTLSGAPRGYRALFAVGWVVGIATLIAAWKGMCVVLHGLHHRHVRPWELFVVDTDDEESGRAAADEEEKGQTSPMTSCGKSSLDSFGFSNSYEDEPWVVKYTRRNVLRKVFEREVWIQEPAVRQIQDTIFVQSILGGLLGAGILTAIFVSVPGGHKF
ncbi:hypothetical protein F4778DRAFT_276177 [Xylariomycetidae sp. FL2044]|nr:hypothetical protein F4778DRAFT_276177 [Xylariomycetidae sp. FL2044]